MSLLLISALLASGARAELPAALAQLQELAEPLPAAALQDREILRLLEKLKSPDSNRRASALMDLGALRSADQADAVAPFLRDPDERVRRSAVWALGRMKASKHADAVAPLLADTEFLISLYAAQALAAMEAAQHAEAVALVMLKVLAPDEATWRSNVLQSLRPVPKGPMRDALGAVFGMHLDHAAPSYRVAAIRLLDVLDFRELSPLIALRLNDGDAGVRRAALLTLGTFKAGDFADAAARMMDDPRQAPQVRQAAANALYLMGAARPAAAAWERGLLENRPRAVRRAVERLVGMQLKDGAWKHIMPSRATTAFAVQALSASLARAETRPASKAAEDGLRLAIERGRGYLLSRLDAYEWRNFNPFESGYRLALIGRDADARVRDEELLQLSVQLLSKGDAGHGVYNATFHSAVMLVGLIEAARGGSERASAFADKLALALESSRVGLYFPYHIRSRALEDSPEGAVGRSVACQYALGRYYAYQREQGRRLEATVARDGAAAHAERSRALLKAYLAALPLLERVAMNLDGKAEPHSGPEHIANYYHYFSVYYAALTMNELASPQDERDRLALSVLRLQDAAGHFQNETSPAYATAISLLVLFETWPAP